MTKDEAQREVIRRWRELPVMNRQTHQEAQAFAELLMPAIVFHTVADRQRVIAAWLIRDIDQKDAVVRILEARSRAGRA